MVKNLINLKIYQNNHIAHDSTSPIIPSNPHFPNGFITCIYLVTNDFFVLSKT